MVKQHYLLQKCYACKIINSKLITGTVYTGTVVINLCTK